VASLGVFNPDVISSDVLVTSGASFPMGVASDVGWEVVMGSSDNKSELLRVNF
jgi:hypothetical protein